MRLCENKYPSHIIRIKESHAYCLTCGKIFKEVEY